MSSLENNTEIKDTEKLIKNSWFIKVAKDKTIISFDGSVLFFDEKNIGIVRKITDKMLNDNSVSTGKKTAEIKDTLAQIEQFYISTLKLKEPIYKASYEEFDYYVNLYMAKKYASFITHFDDGSVQYDKKMIVTNTPIIKTVGVFFGPESVPPKSNNKE